MVDFDFSPEKSRLLKETRGISFEEIVSAIADGCLLDTIEHPNYVLGIDEYVYLVPFVRKGENGVFLKTIFRSRKGKKQYLNG